MTQSTTSNAYPFIENIYECVPLPFTQEQPAPDGVQIPPNALRLVRNLHATPPSFPTNPHRFTIPGNTPSAAEDFVCAMQGTIQWIRQKGTDNTKKLAIDNVSRGSGRRPEFVFKLEYKCPRHGHFKRAANSRLLLPTTSQATLFGWCGSGNTTTIPTPTKTCSSAVPLNE
ncbi:uncharacterized protein PGTG_12249 [Puccinia graminis f. sp. tritici CRL 75-36-700-3]|uniref:Uncharacterized protein n=1 Tax=Puccinia graminis f. sp. tritici (strain CRL 75-36-700-3 / race SCCL) TaxID=418459 RepID=E3KPQ8_PUCGT|nr:uncharacterized protein PGTG_12249 [Puccinia graminis f. sp. tritici CRL 75-36-700-3]EFP86293.1 hypothetical protein PGTG_12249 [Puccinia graminis f. sp. tritici CRL 75-36-700-3]